MGITAASIANQRGQWHRPKGLASLGRNGLTGARWDGTTYHLNRHMIIVIMTVQGNQLLQEPV